MSVESIRVDSIMTKDVMTARASESVRAVASIMSQNNIGSVVITGPENNFPVGIITERDIVSIVGTTDMVMLELLAYDVMSKPVITINAKSSIRDAIQTMQLKNIRRLPVFDNEKKMTVGIVTDKDIFRAIINSQSMISTVSQSLIIEQYRPVYERLSEFVLTDILLPRTSGNQ